jgi:REP element-mobilizing transposase RayT
LRAQKGRFFCVETRRKTECNYFEVIEVPRSARTISAADTYHIVQRGINRQQIFEDGDDCRYYLYLLSETKQSMGYEIYAYCLMGNHLHLLLKTNASPLEDIFRRLGIRYASYFNRKYERAGHLFQGRYLSEVVENDSYLLSALRYIHQNPVNAGLCKTPEEYPWSSSKGYLRGTDEIVNTEFALSLFSKDKQRQVSLYTDFMSEAEGGRILDYRSDAKSKDEQVKKRIDEICGMHNVGGIQQLNINERDELLRGLKAEGASLRRIARLTGISVGIIRRV